ncbi:ribonuclease H-like protein [Auriscalpium vulgare]|uniref:Ribonuclease H-like protein n=1 Tax=Auriscalpium vulgare TaxID=40419 RepID=A0ACB8R938_9AGAM|nr:ribonuclease H-like protein [Auriscalpium vulgare]
MASASSSRYRPPSFNPASSTSRKPVSTSRVLAALDAPTPSSHRGLTPDSDGVIDLTTPEKPARPSVTPFPVDGPRIAKGRTSSLKENEGGKKVAPKSSARALKSASAPAPGASVYSKKPSSAAKPEVKLPTYTYAEYIPKPTVVYVKTEEEANEMVEGLNGAVGFDLEWPIGGKAALVQLCDSSLILLIQVSFMKKFPQKVKEIIEDPAVPKMGVNIRNDGMKLYRDYGILAANLVELGALAGAADTRFAAVYNRRIVSLAKVVAFYLRRALDKGPVRTSDWSAALSKEQMTCESPARAFSHSRGWAGG